MKKAMIALLALGVLAGCANQQETVPATAAPQAAHNASSADDEVPLTGSRLAKRKSTDRLLKSVGNADARDSMDSAPDPLRSGQ